MTFDWELPLTEQGLRQALRQIEECRAKSDNLELSRGLLALAWLVKWVRSDDGTPPFERATVLADEALDAARQSGDPKAILAALLEPRPFEPCERTDLRLNDAEHIAAEDEVDLARVWLARSQHLARRDASAGRELTLKALEVFRRHGNKSGMARCLFGLSVRFSDGDTFHYATEAAELYRELGNPKQASKCVQLALLRVRPTELAEHEGLVRAGLKDLEEVEPSQLTASLYAKLASILEARGEFRQAADYRRWAAETDEATRLSPGDTAEMDHLVKRWTASN